MVLRRGRGPGVVPEMVPGEAAARAGHVQHTPPLHMAHASDSETVVSGKSHLRSGGREQKSTMTVSAK